MCVPPRTPLVCFVFPQCTLPSSAYAFPCVAPPTFASIQWLSQCNENKQSVLQAAADIPACKAATRSLASLLESHLAGSGGSRAAGGGADAAAATYARDAALLDASVARLTQRVRALEAELMNARSELQAAQRRRATLPPPQQAAAGRSGSASAAPQHVRTGSHKSSDTPRTLAERLDAQLQAAVGAGAPMGGEDGDALLQLLEGCLQCAQLHDTAMKRMGEQLSFARNRVNAAANLGDAAKRDAAQKKLDDVRAGADKARTEAGKLESLVTALEATMSASDAFARLRPIAMEVKEVVWRVYTAHDALNTPANSGPTGGSAGRHTRTYTMEEILQAGSKGGRGGGRGGRGGAAHGSTAAAPQQAAAEEDEGYQPFGAGFGVSSGGDDEGGPPSAYYEQQQQHHSEVATQPAMATRQPAQPPAPTAPPPGWAPAVTGQSASPKAAQGGAQARQFTPDEFLSAAAASQTPRGQPAAPQPPGLAGAGAQSGASGATSATNGQGGGSVHANTDSMAKAEDAASRPRMTFGEALASAPPPGRGNVPAGRDAGRGRARSQRA